MRSFYGLCRNEDMSLPFVERSELRSVRDALAPIGPAPSARQTYAAMLEHQVEPTLVSWGLSGAGERYAYPSRVWHLALAVVPAAWNTASRFQFDVTVLAVTRAEWDQWCQRDPALPQEPDPAVYYAQDFVPGGGLRVRLGELQREGLDRRWTVHGGVDPTPVAAEVLAALKLHALPEFAGRAEARPLPA